jgi:hypothetical protein
MTKLAIAFTAASAAVMFLPRLWWHHFGGPRFRARADAFLEHVRRPEFIAPGCQYKCGCDRCRSFRREMGWPP